MTARVEDLKALELTAKHGLWSMDIRCEKVLVSNWLHVESRHPAFVRIVRCLPLEVDGWTRKSENLQFTVMAPIRMIITAIGSANCGSKSSKLNYALFGPKFCVFGPKSCVFRPQIMCFPVPNSVRFGPKFCAFRSHILLLTISGSQNEHFQLSRQLLRLLGVKVFRSCVMWIALLLVLCTEVKCWLG